MSETTHEVSSAKTSTGSLAVPIAIVIAGALIAASIIFTEQGVSAKPSLAAAAPTAEEPAPPNLNSTEAEQLLAIRADDHILGNKGADLVLVVYSDLECPFCKRFHPTMKQILDTYSKQEGGVALVYRHFPLSIHPKARKEGEATECAASLGGNDAFWKYIDRIYEVTPSNNQLNPAELPKIAEYIGLNVGAFTSCLDSGKMATRIEKDFNDGVLLGVRGTPHTIIWNKKTGRKMPVSGALPFENFKTMITAAGTVNKKSPAGDFLFTGLRKSQYKFHFIRRFPLRLKSDLYAYFGVKFLESLLDLSDDLVAKGTKRGCQRHGDIDPFRRVCFDVVNKSKRINIKTKLGVFHRLYRSNDLLFRWGGHNYEICSKPSAAIRSASSGPPVATIFPS